ncbi:hypothetical protein [Gloeothece verrucosa]|uniref:Uncharacterized protein n=1 Tax=Gloeothece verrucosa (strain PCC 7822) TaxID=497965 RepID=E0UD54_GLOV7|nr:hypothetical protein [Gloeothece verrucosa]ADN12934.1 hypothetical protein Cyan7822_0920 [Gloeothece verrucosa PCC 7822]
MSSQVVDFGTLLNKLDIFSDYVAKTADYPKISPRFRSRAAPAKWRRDKSIEKINWDKYGSEVREEYAAIKNILLQGYNPNSREINDPTSLNQFFLRHKEFIVKHWKILTDFDKKTLKIVAQEIKEGFEMVERINFANPSIFTLLGFLLLTFLKMLQNRGKPHRFIHFDRLKALMANWKLFGSNRSRSNELRRAMVSLYHTLADWSNTIVGLAQLEPQEEEAPLYETATHEEWSRALREWAAGQVHPGPPLSNEAIRRENIYEERF